jgi:NTE family protein
MTARRRVGLALAGGGPGGAVYEIGALRALEETLEGVEFTDLHTYVGVSAGAFVAAALANGIGPTQLVRAIVKHEPGESPFLPEVFFRPAYKDWAKRSLRLPKLLSKTLLRLARHPGDQTVQEALTRLAEGLPVALFDNEPLRAYLAQVLSRPGRTDDFRKLEHKLIVVATDLGAAQSIRFGEPGWDHIPISRAVQASTAIPGLYPPVLIEGRQCVDGVLLKTLHASVALERGARLLFCINPIVPADLSTGEARGLFGEGGLMEGGLATVLSQTFRTLIHSRLEVGMAAYKTRYPDADVVLFEPDQDEYRMFFTNIFSFGARRAVCELAYRATRRTLRRRRRELGPLLERHGVRLRDDVLDDEARDLWTGVGLPAQGPGPAAVARDLERTLESIEEQLSEAGGGAPKGAR